MIWIYKLDIIYNIRVGDDSYDKEDGLEYV